MLIPLPVFGSCSSVEADSIHTGKQGKQGKQNSEEQIQEDFKLTGGRGKTIFKVNVDASENPYGIKLPIIISTSPKKKHSASA